MLADSVSHLARFKFSWYLTLMNCLCRCLRKNKGHPKVQRLTDYYVKHLDIRSIMRNSISLQDFLRCWLSEKQKVLLAHQRTRVATSDKNRSTNSEAEDPLGKFSAEIFVRKMNGFEPKDDFERRLVQGVLFRSGKIGKSTAGGIKDEIKSEQSMHELYPNQS